MQIKVEIDQVKTANFQSKKGDTLFKQSGYAFIGGGKYPVEFSFFIDSLAAAYPIGEYVVNAQDNVSTNAYGQLQFNMYLKLTPVASKS